MESSSRRRNKTHTAIAGDLLIQAVRDLSSAATLSEITAIVKRTARRLADADGATFVLREDDPEDLCYYADEDAIAPLWKGRRFPVAVCISGWSMLYRQQAIVPDIYADDRVPHDAYRPTFVRSLVMTPVRTLRPWAAIGVYWARRRVPTPHEAGWLQSLADSTAVAMENVRVRARLVVSREREAAAETVRPDTAAAPPVVRMCAWTRRFELDGQWVSVEEFLERRLGLMVSHGVSDEAIEMLESRRSRRESLALDSDEEWPARAEDSERHRVEAPRLTLHG